ncbi:phosphonatase-like hydrolase [Saccharopolyspora sp. CA-218241]|uniref:phosphonatase-like hydrolase n=1 Tax=Saccharopolyspora sp. CA-218241 TaxID=3240027 RepID=UPI003D953C78
MSTESVELVVFDMAGTTVADDGLVERAFRAAADRTGLIGPAGPEPLLEHVRATMGQSKITVFRHLTGGDEQRAQEANEAFENAYAELVSEGSCTPLPGAERTFAALRAADVRIALTTGFAQATQEAILDALGWREIADVALCPATAGRGRPHPDLPLTALLRTGTSSVRAMVVVGDTTSDVVSGLRAGAGAVYGVRTGAHGETELRAAGATDVLAGIGDLPAALGLPS